MTGYRFFLCFCLVLAAILLASAAFADSGGPLVGPPVDVETAETGFDQITGDVAGAPELRKRSRRPDPFRL